jgi:hypothetical protein
MSDKETRRRAVLRDSSIECPHYVAIAGTRRCRSYLDGGGCAREDTFLCTEWLRKNPPQRATKQSTPMASPPQVPAASTDLFGQVVRVQPSSTSGESKRSRTSAIPLPAQTAPSLARPITEDQIRALEALGIELCVRADAIGELWLVPAYTGAERNEMTFRDAATIAAMCAVFPGAEVTQFHRAPTRSEST